jgi:hypothetical protein
MFRITQGPSSGSYIQYLTKITDNGSIVQVCYVRCQCYSGMCRTCTTEPLSVILVEYWILCPDDGFCVIRNMLEQFFFNILNIYWF